MFLSFFSSSLCRGLAAVCDCGRHTLDLSINAFANRFCKTIDVYTIWILVLHCKVAALQIVQRFCTATEPYTVLS